MFVHLVSIFLMTRLCRNRKLYALHLRLEHNQVPAGRLPLVGSMGLYDKAEIWTVDDEKGFRFDIDNGIVYWEREIVDLVRICDTCLQDLFAAASCCTRFVGICCHFCHSS